MKADERHGIRVAGADGWKRGWVAVLLGDGDPEVRSFPDFGALAADLPEAEVIVVDIPIGGSTRLSVVGGLVFVRWGEYAI